MITLDFVFTTLLIAIRLGVLFISTPLLAEFKLPGQIRMLLGISLSCALALGLPQYSVKMPAEMDQAFSMALEEGFAGLLLSLAVSTAFASLSIAARLLDIQIGYGIGQVFDPATQQQTPALSSMFAIAAVALFFSMDLHHTLLRSVADLFAVWPPGSHQASALDIEWMIRAGGQMYVRGLLIVAPVVASLLLTELGLGLVARTMPQINVFTLGLPLKIAVGLATLGDWAHTDPDGPRRLFDAATASLFSWGR